MMKKNIAWSIYGASIILYLASFSTGILLLMNIHKRFVLKIDTVPVKNQLVLYGSLAIATFIAAICTMMFVNHLIDQIKTDLGITTSHSADTHQGACLNADDICCMALCWSCCAPDIRCGNDDASAICLIFAGVLGLVSSFFGYLFYAYKTAERLMSLKDNNNMTFGGGYSAFGGSSGGGGGNKGATPTAPPPSYVSVTGANVQPVQGADRNSTFTTL